MTRLFHIVACSALMFGVADAARAQGTCITVNQVDLIGVALFTPVEQAEWVTPFEGRCVGLGEINQILEVVTLSYVDAGFVTARAYLPEQNLADGSLEIRVIEGELSAITFNGTSRPNWQGGVFPNMIGRPLNLREVEQGLEQIRSMPTYSAEMEIEAGAEQGQSVLAVSALSERPWSASISVNNQGSSITGENIFSLDLGYDNPLGLNDRWTLKLGQSWGPDGAGTGNGSFAISVPRGAWSFDSSFAWSDYQQETPGIFAPIPVDGWTQTYALSAKRILDRDRDTKTSLELSLERRENVNNIANVQIGSSSRVVTSLGLTLSHQRPLWGGQLDASLGWEQGIKALGAEDFASQPAGQPNAQYGVANFELRLTRPWQLEKGALFYTGSLRGQWSDDRLYGTQQMSLGGSSSVYGSKSGLISGNRGVLWRNELRYALANAPDALGQLSFYTGADVGHIFPQSDYSIAGGSLAGVVIGIRAKGGWADIDLSYQQIIKASGSIPVPDGVFLFSISRSF